MTSPHPAAEPLPQQTASRTDRIRRWVSSETTGGLLLLGAALVAVLFANSPWRDGYTRLSESRLGPAALHLDLTLAHWASDGLLAVFFFVVGLVTQAG